MPHLDKTGPMGSGRPGKGFGPCHNESHHTEGKEHMHRHGHQHGCKSENHQHEHQHDDMYVYSAEELNKRKQTLEKELQWLNERIKEIGESNENSNPVN